MIQTKEMTTVLARETLANKLFGEEAAKNPSALLLETIVRSIVVPTRIIDEILTGIPKDKFPKAPDLVNDFDFAENLLSFGLAYRFVGNSEVSGQLLTGAENIFRMGLKESFSKRDNKYRGFLYFTDVSLIPLPHRKPWNKGGRLSCSGIPFFDLTADELRVYDAKSYLMIIDLAKGSPVISGLANEDLLKVSSDDMAGLTDGELGVFGHAIICQDIRNIKAGLGFKKFRPNFMEYAYIYTHPKYRPLYCGALDEKLRDEAHALSDFYRSFEDSFLNGKESKDSIVSFYTKWSNTMLEILMIYRSRFIDKYRTQNRIA